MLQNSKPQTKVRKSTRESIAEHIDFSVINNAVFNADLQESVVIVSPSVSVNKSHGVGSITSRTGSNPFFTTEDLKTLTNLSENLPEGSDKSDKDDTNFQLAEKRWFRFWHRWIPLYRPFDPSIERWVLIMVVMMIIVAVFVPFDVAFLPNTYEFFALNRLLDLMFVIDMYVHWNLAFLDKYGILITSRRQIRMRYLRGWFLVDLLTVFPFDDVMRSMGYNLPGLVVLRLIRLLRLLKLTDYIRSNGIFQRYEARSHINYSMTRLYTFLASLFVMCHWMGCGWFLLVVLEDNRECYFKDELDACCYNWFDCYLFVNMGSQRSLFRKYFISLTWATDEILTLGSTIESITDTERVYQLIARILSGIVYAYLLGAVCSIFTAASKNETMFYEQMDSLNKFIKWSKLKDTNQEFCMRLRMFFRFVYDHRDTSQEIMELLSPHLKSELAWQIHSGWLQNLEVFQGEDLPASFYLGVSLTLEPITFAPFELIIQPHHNSDKIFVVWMGSVMAKRLVSKGQVFGLEAFQAWRSNMTFGYNATGVCHGQLYSLKMDHLYDVLNRPQHKQETRFVHKNINRTQACALILFFTRTVTNAARTATSFIEANDLLFNELDFVKESARLGIQEILFREYLVYHPDDKHRGLVSSLTRKLSSRHTPIGEASFQGLESSSRRRRKSSLYLHLDELEESDGQNKHVQDFVHKCRKTMDLARYLARVELHEKAAHFVANEGMDVDTFLKMTPLQMHAIGVPMYKAIKLHEMDQKQIARQKQKMDTQMGRSGFTYKDSDFDLEGAVAMVLTRLASRFENSAKYDLDQIVEAMDFAGLPTNKAGQVLNANCRRQNAGAGKKSPPLHVKRSYANAEASETWNLTPTPRKNDGKQNSNGVDRENTVGRLSAPVHSFNRQTSTELASDEERVCTEDEDSDIVEYTWRRTQLVSAIDQSDESVLSSNGSAQGPDVWEEETHAKDDAENFAIDKESRSDRTPLRYGLDGNSTEDANAINDDEKYAKGKKSRQEEYRNSRNRYSLGGVLSEVHTGDANTENRTGGDESCTKNADEENAANKDECSQIADRRARMSSLGELLPRISTGGTNLGCDRNLTEDAKDATEMKDEMGEGNMKLTNVSVHLKDVEFLYDSSAEARNSSQDGENGKTVDEDIRAANIEAVAENKVENKHERVQFPSSVCSLDENDVMSRAGIHAHAKSGLNQKLVEVENMNIDDNDKSTQGSIQLSSCPLDDDDDDDDHELLSRNPADDETAGCDESEKVNEDDAEKKGEGAISFSTHRRPSGDATAGRNESLANEDDVGNEDVEIQGSTQTPSGVTVLDDKRLISTGLAEDDKTVDSERLANAGEGCIDEDINDLGSTQNSPIMINLDDEFLRRNSAEDTVAGLHLRPLKADEEKAVDGHEEIGDILQSIDSLSLKSADDQESGIHAKIHEEYSDGEDEEKWNRSHIPKHEMRKKDNDSASDVSLHMSGLSADSYLTGKSINR